LSWQNSTRGANLFTIPRLERIETANEVFYEIVEMHREKCASSSGSCIA